MQKAIENFKHFSIGLLEKLAINILHEELIEYVITFKFDHNAKCKANRQKMHLMIRSCKYCITEKKN